MWFNRGSGGSPVRLNRLPHGFTPASLRCLCAMDPESSGKALQDCLRALGTEQGADLPAAPAPQAAAAPRAPHLADKFPLKEEVVVHNTCNPDTTHSGSDGRPTHLFDGSLWTVLMANHVWPWVPRGKPRRGPPGSKRGKNWSSFPRSGRRRAMQLGQRGQLLQSRTAQASVSPTLPRRL